MIRCAFQREGSDCCVENGSVARSGVAGPAAGTQGRTHEFLYLCTESPEEWASHLRGETLPEGGVSRDEVEGGVNRATESGTQHGPKQQIILFG